MKKVYIKFLATLLAFSSCNKEEKIIDTIVSEKTSKNKVQNKNRISNENFASNYQDPFEIDLQDLSFLIGQALLNHESSRQGFLDVYNNSYQANQTSRVIKLNELFNDDPNLNPFRNAFEEEFTYYKSYQACIGRPDGELTVGNSQGTGGSHFIENDFEVYLNLILNEECVEIYMPNEISFETEERSLLTIISSAHPLNNSDYNESYVSTGRCIKIEETLNASRTGNVMILRPFRSQNERGGCQYSEYSSIDFTEFLAN